MPYISKPPIKGVHDYEPSDTGEILFTIAIALFGGLVFVALLAWTGILNFVISN